MGVAPRRLMGWEPAEVTTHTYVDGVLTRSVTVREPEFSAGDLALLRGHLRDERVPRGEHGHLLSEAMSKDADPSSHDSKYKYVASLPHADFAQKALSDAIAGYRKAYPDADTSALRWSVERVPVT